MRLAALLLALSGAGAASGSVIAPPRPPTAPWKPAAAPLTTPWTADVSPTSAHAEHPRPQLTRAAGSWQTLNGLWELDYTQTPSALDGAPPAQPLPHSILLPFPIESSLSGIRKLAPNFTTIYRRVLPAASLLPACAGTRMLRFERVDWNATVMMMTLLLVLVLVLVLVLLLMLVLQLTLSLPLRSGPTASGSARTSAATRPGAARCRLATSSWCWASWTTLSGTRATGSRAASRYKHIGYRL